MGLYETLKAAKLGAASDVFTTLRGRQAPFAKGGTTEKELEDTPPLSFKGNGQPLIDWSIYGNTENGEYCGDRTSNLFDGSIERGSLNEGASIGTDYNNTKTPPTAVLNSYRVRTTNPIYIDRELTLSVDFNSYQMYVLFYDENQQYTGSHSSSWINSSLILSGEYIGKYIGLAVKSKGSGNVPISPTDNIKLMLNSGSTAQPYEPPGYKLPVQCGGETTNIYIAEPLGASDSISMTDTGISIPTVDGSNTLSVGTTVQPSSVYIKYKE